MTPNPPPEPATPASASSAESGARYAIQGAHTWDNYRNHPFNEVMKFSADNMADFILANAPALRAMAAPRANPAGCTTPPVPPLIVAHDSDGPYLRDSAQNAYGLAEIAAFVNGAMPAPRECSYSAWQLIDWIDLMKDEFERIRNLSGDTEIKGLCDRAVTNIHQRVNVINQRDEWERKAKSFQTRVYELEDQIKEAAPREGDDGIKRPVKFPDMMMFGRDDEGAFVRTDDGDKLHFHKIAAALNAPGAEVLHTYAIPASTLDASPAQVAGLFEGGRWVNWLDMAEKFSGCGYGSILDDTYYYARSTNHRSDVNPLQGYQIGEGYEIWCDEQAEPWPVPMPPVAAPEGEVNQ